MAKYCDICNKKIGAFSISYKANDGSLCGECINIYIKKTGTSREQALLDIKCSSIKQIKNILSSTTETEKMLSIFSPNKNIAELLKIDEVNKLWGVPQVVGFVKTQINKVYSFDDIIGYETDEEKEVVAKNKGTLGRSLVGGVLFGGVGALIGGATSKKVTEENVKNITIRIKVKSSINPS